MSLALKEIMSIVNSDDVSSVLNILVDEETLAVLFVGVGVLLEGREVFTSRISKTTGKAPANQDEELDEECAYYGMIILSIGLLIEIIDQFMTLIEHSPYVTFFLQFGINLPLNIYGIVLLIVISGKLLKPGYYKPA
jgi:hypothetical protein